MSKTMILCKKISCFTVVAFGGILSAIFGAFCGWVLFPALVAFNVNKVNTINLPKNSKMNINRMNFVCAANRSN